MHTVLGANGVIGRELSRHLASSAKQVRQVSRSPRRVDARDELVAADLLERLRAGRTPQWIGDAGTVHTFTYTPDAVHAVAVLGRSAESYGRTWHVPTTKEPPTGTDFVRTACELAGRPYELQVAPRWMLRLLGLFMPVLRENDEMLYQFEYDYRFDGSRIEAAHGLQPTPYRTGIAACLSGSR